MGQEGQGGKGGGGGRRRDWDKEEAVGALAGSGLRKKAQLHNQYGRVMLKGNDSIN